MSTPLVLAGVALCAVLAVWAGWRAWRDRPVVVRQLWGAAVVELYLVAQAVAVAVHLGDGRGGVSALFWIYVATQLALLPLAALWAFAERSRWSSVVLAVAALVVAFLQYRLLTVWGQG
jgi:hypothetical protein